MRSTGNVVKISSSPLARLIKTAKNSSRHAKPAGQILAAALQDEFADFSDHSTHQKSV
jgi:hypothetical protein